MLFIIPIASAVPVQKAFFTVVKIDRGTGHITRFHVRYILYDKGIKPFIDQFIADRYVTRFFSGHTVTLFPSESFPTGSCYLPGNRLQILLNAR